MREKYSTDLTDEQWNEIAPLFVGMRKTRVGRCCVIFGIYSTQFLSTCKIKWTLGQNFATFGKSDAEKCRFFDDKKNLCRWRLSQNFYISGERIFEIGNGNFAKNYAALARTTSTRCRLPKVCLKFITSTIYLNACEHAF